MNEILTLTFARLLREPVLLIAFGFGSGLAPVAPGTFGTLAAAVLAPALLWCPAPVAWALLAVAVVGGVLVCGVAVRRLGVADHPGIVWDEFTGLWLALLLAPPSLPAWLAALALFRLFDIIKPWPISWVDRHWHGGLGVMADDLIAGLLAGVAVQLLARAL